MRRDEKHLSLGFGVTYIRGFMVLHNGLSLSLSFFFISPWTNAQRSKLEKKSIRPFCISFYGVSIISGVWWLDTGQVTNHYINQWWSTWVTGLENKQHWTPCIPVSWNWYILLWWMTEKLFPKSGWCLLCPVGDLRSDVRVRMWPANWLDWVSS